MLRRCIALLLAVALCLSLTACKPGEEPPASSSVTENPYASGSPAVTPEAPDYSAAISATAAWIFDNAAYLTCEREWAATLIEITSRRGTPEAQALLPVVTPETAKLDTAADVAKQILAAIMLGGDPESYIEGVDLVQMLRSAQTPQGWFYIEPEPESFITPIPEADPSVSDLPTPTPEATATPEPTPTPEATPEGVPTATPIPEQAPFGALEDTIWALIALRLCRAEFDREGAVAYLEQARHSDGGFALDSELSEVSTTALCLLGLYGMTGDGAKQVYNDAMEYLIASYNEDGYFVGSAAGSAPNTVDQALGAVAVIAARENIYAGRWLKNGSTMIDRLIGLREVTGGYPELVSGDATCSAIAVFALVCAQTDGLIWNNYALADLEPGE